MIAAGTTGLIAATATAKIRLLMISLMRSREPMNLRRSSIEAFASQTGAPTIQIHHVT